MWDPDEAVSVRGARCTAVLSRRVAQGVHLYPTATLRMPALAQARTLWRLQVGKMKNGLGVGIKTPALERGRVFGRQASVDLVWWLSNTGQLYNGSEQEPLFADATATAPSQSESDPKDARLSTWRFGAGDVVCLRVDGAKLSVRVNERSWSQPVQITPKPSAAAGAACTETPQRTSSGVIELAVQMLDAGDQVAILDHDVDSVLEGELCKRANSLFVFSPWQTRWFALKNDALFYREGRTLPAAKMLDLRGVTGCIREGKRHIRIKHEARVLRLRAASPLECEVWLQALEAALHAHQRAGEGPVRPATAWAGSAQADAARRSARRADSLVRPFTTPPRARPPALVLERDDEHAVLQAEEGKAGNGGGQNRAGVPLRGSAVGLRAALNPPVVAATGDSYAWTTPTKPAKNGQAQVLHVESVASTPVSGADSPAAAAIPCLDARDPAPRSSVSRQICARGQEGERARGRAQATREGASDREKNLERDAALAAFRTQHRTSEPANANANLGEVTNEGPSSDMEMTHTHFDGISSTLPCLTSSATSTLPWPPPSPEPQVPDPLYSHVFGSSPSRAAAAHAVPALPAPPPPARSRISTVTACRQARVHARTHAHTHTRTHTHTHTQPTRTHRACTHTHRLKEAEGYAKGLPPWRRTHTPSNQLTRSQTSH